MDDQQSVFCKVHGNKRIFLIEKSGTKNMFGAH
jgi:hypothetical protein